MIEFRFRLLLTDTQRSQRDPPLRRSLLPSADRSTRRQTVLGEEREADDERATAGEEDFDDDDDSVSKARSSRFHRYGMIACLLLPE